MLTIMLMAAGMGQAAGSAPEQIPAYEASFRPLRKSERTYAKNGPAGPYYPQRAHDAASSGAGIIRCKLVAAGELRACQPVAELPRDSDFAHAARALAQGKRIFIDGDPPPAEAVLVKVPFQFGAPALVEP